MNFEGRNIILINIAVFLTLSMPLAGGLLYVAGSLVYWPSFTDLNPNDGGILFIAGSVALWIADLATSYIQPEFSFHKPLDNAGSFRNCIIMLGNVAFIVGSVYFLEELPLIVGCDLFLISSLFQFAGQVMAIWGVVSLNPFTAPYYAKFIRHKASIVWINIFLFIGCLGFVLGSYLFVDFNTQSVQLQEIAVMLYAVGSFGYVLSALVSFKLKKTRLVDPLAEYHQKMHSYYFSKNYNPTKIVPLLNVVPTSNLKKKQPLKVNQQQTLQDSKQKQRQFIQIQK